MFSGFRKDGEDAKKTTYKSFFTHANYNYFIRLVKTKAELSNGERQSGVLDVANGNTGKNNRFCSV
ncbi:hypothetical protein CR164_07985 [Prosthecochloris marina]|uniref:Uncharacterized protein n=1 Tax=Prosthecochloris marina TaxID=2017681 RepID=A0A317T4R7_9CHLB|nr:hypothetical protein CR164_07985 [Prosthecochloris marina]